MSIIFNIQYFFFINKMWIPLTDFELKSDIRGKNQICRRYQYIFCTEFNYNEFGIRPEVHFTHQYISYCFRWSSIPKTNLH